MGDPKMAMDRMQACICRWEEEGDERSIFLRCYAMMTANMLAAIEAGEFHDRAWVRRLLTHFADYYFIALDAYDVGDEGVPAVWRQTHDAARRAGTLALQNLLLGVNAHINYDLVLATADLLEEEWPGLSSEARRQRRDDYNHVNEIIERTVDAVQDEILERRQPMLQVVDTVFGPVDEWLIGRQITRWRNDVWEEAVRRVEMADAEEREHHRRSVETAVLRWTQRFGG